MLTGLDHLIAQNFEPLRGQRVGLLTNPSAVTRDLVSAYEVFRRVENIFTLTALFAPEHGFAGAIPAGDPVATYTDPLTGVPVHSLYGAAEQSRPTAAMLRDLDVLVCDIQDIGVRYYTFTWTITHAIEACGEHGVRVLILDRPNPLPRIDGPTLDPGVSSIVGRVPVPVRHGLTLGEMARMFNTLWNPTPADLTVVPCDPTGAALWIPPSPNMPHLSTLAHYPGACLIEGTNLSEGRGTALPFEIVGAPFIDGAALAEELNMHDLPGVKFRPHVFEPTASKWAHHICGGVQAHITDAALFRPIHTWLDVLLTTRRLYGEKFEWHSAHFDRLIGNPRVRQAIDAGDSLDTITAGWEVSCREFEELRRPYLLYT